VIDAKLDHLIQVLAADSKHDQAVVSIGFEDALELGHLLQAWPAPGGLKIEQSRMLAVWG